MFRNSGYFFIGLLGLTLLAFWNTYVAIFPGSFDPYTHIHAALMLAWFALLIAQPFLIRGDYRRIHRALGKLSYGLVPAIAIATALLAHQRITSVPDEALDETAKFFFLPPGMMALFVFAYALAIIHRKTAALHARYMMCTFLAAVDPVVGRLVGIYGPPLPDDRYAQLVSYLVCVAALGALIIRERHQRAGRAAFPTMLVATTIVFGLFFTWAHTASWVDLTRWYRGLPIT